MFAAGIARFGITALYATNGVHPQPPQLPTVRAMEEGDSDVKRAIRTALRSIKAAAVEPLRDESYEHLSA